MVFAGFSRGRKAVGVEEEEGPMVSQSVLNALSVQIFFVRNQTYAC
jgi:hypothetical protein